MSKIKPVMEWIKSHGLLVGLGVLGVGGFVGGIAGSTMWGSGVVTDLQNKISSDASALAESANKVTYTMDPLVQGEQVPSETRLPNAKLTEWFKAQRAKRAEASKSVVAELIAFNRGHRTDLNKMFLVERLFPKPAATEGSLKAREMARAVEEAPAKLLSIVRAGSPPDAEDMKRSLGDRRAERVLAMVPPGQNEQALTPEQQAELSRDLVSFRVRRYQMQAERIGVYATPAAISLPKGPAQGDPSLNQCWDWQMQVWAIEDVLRAIAAANAPAADRGVPAAIVKRIESISVQPMPGLVVGREGGAGGGGPEGGSTGGATDAGTPPDPNAAPLNASVSITGRQSGPGTGNGLYDLRKIDLTVIADAQSVPQIIDALAKVNLMTVLRMELEQVDSVQHLNEGYFYGRQPVVRATMTIESLWLREWTTPFMPEPVRTALGIPASAPAEGTTPPPG